MPYAPIFGRWSADDVDDWSALGHAPNSSYPLDWLLPAQPTGAAPGSFVPQFAGPPQAVPPPAFSTVDQGSSSAGLPPPAPTAGPSLSPGDLPWWLSAPQTPPASGQPFARAPLATPEWASTYSLLGLVGQLQNRFVPDGPPIDMTMSLFPRPPGAAEELPPRGSVLLTKLRAAQPGILPPDQERDSDGSDQIARDLAAPGLPISKSGASFFPPPPQPSVVPPTLSRSWLDIASLAAPNIVDYFTKPVPPPAPFPSTPGKIPSSDYNPYAGPALQDAVNLGVAVASAAEGVSVAFARSASTTAAETGLASGRTLSAAERLAVARRAQLALNLAAGRAFENDTAAELGESGIEFAPQITVQLPSGRLLRLDFVTREPTTGEIGCIECKVSPTAQLRQNQALGFPELEQAGAMVVGKGKPGFPGGTKIPPTRVEIRRPEG
jgi:hypothetical protein